MTERERLEKADLESIRLRGETPNTSYSSGFTPESLKQVMEDAKQVRQTALENAKKALEDAFKPQNMKVIGIAGYARCGKDTFVGIARQILSEHGYNPIRIAFADELKKEVQSMLQQNKFVGTIYDETPDGKKFNRPLLVWWGCQRRIESPDGLYWVNRANDAIRSKITNYSNLNSLVFLVSDVRFLNEAEWVHNSWNGKVIHLKRYAIDKLETTEKQDVFVYDPAPNEEEAKNDPLVERVADYKVEWENKGKLTSEEAIQNPYLREIVYGVLQEMKLVT